MCGTTRDYHHHTVAISNKVTIVGQRINKPIRKKNGRDVREERLTPRISYLSTRFKPSRHFVRLATSRLRDRRRCQPGTLTKRPKASDEVALAGSGSGLSADWPPNQQKPETVSNGLEKVYNFISIPKILYAVLSLFSQVYALLGVRLRWTSIKINHTFRAFHFILFGVSELVRARIGIHLDEHQVFSVSLKMSRNLTYYLRFFETQYSKRYFLGKPFIVSSLYCTKNSNVELLRVKKPKTRHSFLFLFKRMNTHFLFSQAMPCSKHSFYWISVLSNLTKSKGFHFIELEWCLSWNEMMKIAIIPAMYKAITQKWVKEFDTYTV